MRTLFSISGRLTSAAATVLLLMGLGAVGQSTAEAQLPEGMHFDDSFSFYSVGNHGRMSSGEVVNAYRVVAWARILGDNIARDSGFRFVYKQGSTVLGEARCAGRQTYRNAYLPSNPTDGLTISNCSTPEPYFSAAGEVTVEVYFTDDATDQEHLAATQTIEILELRQETGAGERRPSEFAVNQHGSAALVYMDQTSRRQQYMFSAMDGNAASGSSGDSQLSVVFSRSSGESAISQPALRCAVDGQRIDFGYGRVRSASVTQRQTRATQRTATDSPSSSATIRATER